MFNPTGTKVEESSSSVKTLSLSKLISNSNSLIEPSNSSQSLGKPKPKLANDFQDYGQVISYDSELTSNQISKRG